MKFENQIIQKINSGSIDVSCSICLSNCIIDTLDFVGIEFEKEVIIRRCIIPIWIYTHLGLVKD